MTIKELLVELFLADGRDTGGAQEQAMQVIARARRGEAVSFKSRGITYVLRQGEGPDRTLN